jgi:cell division protein FtsB
MTSPSTSAENPKVGGSFKFLGWIALALGIITISVVLFSHSGLYQFYRFRHERQRLEQENVRLAVENARLARTIDRLQHDPVLIQDLIRQELNFVKKNEIIFQFPPEKPVAALHNSGIDATAHPELARGQAISARKVENPKLVCPPEERPVKKRGSHRRP